MSQAYTKGTINDKQRPFCTPSGLLSRLVVAVRAAAAVLDTALSALLVSLDTLDPSERDEEERTRMARIQELLQHELALLPADM